MPYSIRKRTRKKKRILFGGIATMVTAIACTAIGKQNNKDLILVPELILLGKDK